MPQKFAVAQSEYRLATVAGRRLSCLICGAGEFWRSKIMFNTREATFWGFDWADRQGEAATCRSCGFVHSFAGGLEWVTPSPAEEPQ